MLTKLKLKLESRVESRKNRTRYKVELLKNKERMETFRLTMSNKYETLQDFLGEHGSKPTLGMSTEDMDQHMRRSSAEEKEAT